MNKLIFCYGTLKAGFRNNFFLENAELLGEHTTEPNFTMYSMWGYPAIVPEGNTPIRGEVYRITDERTMLGVNRLEGHYGRGNKSNHYDTMDIQTPFGEAEVFIYHESPRTQVVKSGVWEK